MKILISACLLGIPCRYDGRKNTLADLQHLLSLHQLVPVCPEQLGGLPTPRAPAELRADGRVCTKSGQDVSLAFQRGAEAALQIFKACRCDAALLKARSPSCGKGRIYDGSFSRTLKDGNGIFASLCLANGIPVFHEEEIGLLLKNGA